MGPWTREQIEDARRVTFEAVLDYLGAYYKRDAEFAPAEADRQSVRVFANYRGRDFRFIFTGEKWLNELLPQGALGRGGGGAIDFARHVTGFHFVSAVKVCLDALESTKLGKTRDDCRGAATHGKGS
jgi:hypothetical protein